MFCFDRNRRKKETKGEYAAVATDSTPQIDVFQKAMGSFGPWHWWITFAIFMVKLPVAFHQLNIVLVAPIPDFYCEDTNLDKCAKNCSQHVFNRTIFSETIITEWDLVCERKYLADLAQTITMTGILVGNVIFGYFSDKYGRRNPLIIAVVIQTLAGVASALAPWLWLYLALRFMVALATGGTMITSFVLCMEVVGTKWRTAVATLYQIPFNIGNIIMAAFSYLLRDWHHFQLSISLPSILLISYYWILPESPRWLITMGRKEEAAEVLAKVSKINKINHSIEDIRKDIDSVSKNTGVEVKRSNFFDLFRTRKMRVRTLCMNFNWFMCGLCFYGCSQYIGQLGGQLFTNVALSAVMQIPGIVFALFVMQRIGRKYGLIVANLLGGAAMLLIPFVEAGGMAQKCFAITGVVAFMMSFAVVYVYAGELFPTVVRNIALGSFSMSARIGAMITPFITSISINTGILWVPPVVFGSLPIIGGVLCIWLPETLNCRLPDTIEEAEMISNKVKPLPDNVQMKDVDH